MSGDYIRSGAIIVRDALPKEEAGVRDARTYLYPGVILASVLLGFLATRSRIEAPEPEILADNLVSYRDLYSESAYGRVSLVSVSGDAVTSTRELVAGTRAASFVTTGEQATLKSVEQELTKRKAAQAKEGSVTRVGITSRAKPAAPRSQPQKPQSGSKYPDSNYSGTPLIVSEVRPVQGDLSQVPFNKLAHQVLRVIKSHGRKGVDIQKLASTIVTESRALNYDPLFVAAVIKSESAFDALATSKVGAKGLMQIMPATGKYVEKFENFQAVRSGRLTDPNYNVRLGITYLRYLEDLYEGNRVLTLIAYNWGPGHVDLTIRGKKRGVPRSVVNYALKILSDHNRWQHELTSSARAFS